MKKTGCFLAALGMFAASSMPATAGSLSEYGLQNTTILHNGVTAALHLTVPFGGRQVKAPEPRLALGFDYYRSSTPTGSPFVQRTYRASLASIDFTQGGFKRLALGNQTALTATHDPVDGTRLNLSAPKPSTILWGAVIIGAAVGVYFLVDSGGGGATSGFGG